MEKVTNSTRGYPNIHTSSCAIDEVYMEKWGYVWPKDEWGNRKSINDFTDLEHVRYVVYLARLECTLGLKRDIRNEIMYLHNWYSYFSQLTKIGQFDPECLKYLSLEIVRLYKESSAWQ